MHTRSYRVGEAKSSFNQSIGKNFRRAAKGGIPAVVRTSPAVTPWGRRLALPTGTIESAAGAGMSRCPASAGDGTAGRVIAARHAEAHPERKEGDEEDPTVYPGGRGCPAIAGMLREARQDLHLLGHLWLHGRRGGCRRCRPCAWPPTGSPSGATLIALTQVRSAGWSTARMGTSIRGGMNLDHLACVCCSRCNDRRLADRMAAESFLDGGNRGEGDVEAGMRSMHETVPADGCVLFCPASGL